jgi:diguanylate cyclase (GGDEF)-like protein
MPNEQDDKLNKLFGHRVSIAERTRIAKELDDDKLQMAAPYSPQAKEELERRRHERLLEGRPPGKTTIERELEQKFRILYSPAQMEPDFDHWRSDAAEVTGYSVGVIFLDIDNFKQFNIDFTEAVVDRTLLPDLQRQVASLCLHRGFAYRYGGEELVILLPNCTLDEAAAFAHKVCGQIAANTFRVQKEEIHMTVSVGVAVWPLHGDTLQQVIERANREERIAKDRGKNSVAVATV